MDGESFGSMRRKRRLLGAASCRPKPCSVSVDNDERLSRLFCATGIGKIWLQGFSYDA
jgi:hypothetical protein